MSFSVLMSLYVKERPDYLRQSLDSVFNQTLRADEVVIVEDGPLTPELYQVLEEYQKTFPELKRVPLPVNGGLGKALNAGLKHCSHPLIARMDTDDICFPNRFEKQVKLMEKRPEVAACSSWIDEFIDTPDNVVSIKKVPELTDDIFRFGKNRCPINHPAAIYRKEVALNVGGYGPFPEDYYLWARMLMNGYKLYNFQESLLWFRSSKDVYKRRGGWHYFKAINRLQRELLKMHYLTPFEYAKNSVIRSVVSLMPNKTRSWFYSRFLRDEK